MTKEEKVKQARRLFDERIETGFFGQLEAIERLGDEGIKLAGFLRELQDIEGLVMRRFFAEKAVKGLQKVGRKAWLVSLEYTHVEAEMRICQSMLKVRVYFGAKTAELVSAYRADVLEEMGVNDLEELLDFHLMNVALLDKRVGEWFNKNGQYVSVLGGCHE